MSDAVILYVRDSVGPIAVTVTQKAPIRLLKFDFEQGWQGTTIFEFVQSIPSIEWIINHNLGRYPDIKVFTLGGQEMIADTVNPTPNQSRVLFSIPSVGIVNYS